MSWRALKSLQRAAITNFRLKNLQRLTISNRSSQQLPKIQICSLQQLPPARKFFKFCFPYRRILAIGGHFLLKTLLASDYHLQSVSQNSLVFSFLGHISYQVPSPSQWRTLSVKNFGRNAQHMFS